MDRLSRVPLPALCIFTGAILAFTEFFGADEALREATRDLVSPVSLTSPATGWSDPLARAMKTVSAAAGNAPIDKITDAVQGDQPTVTIFTGKPTGGEDRQFVVDARSGALLRTEAYADKPFLNRLHSGEAFGDGGLVFAMLWATALFGPDDHRPDHLSQAAPAHPDRDQEGLLVTRRGAFAAALLLGLIVRLAALPLPGTEDVRTWKIWAFGASRHVTHVYGVGGTPPVRGVLSWQSRDTTVDYPPAALYVLALVGLGYRQFDASFADSRALTAAVKLPGLLCGIGLTMLLAWAARRMTGDEQAGRWAALAYWLNPATVINGEVLGYLDPLMMLPAHRRLRAAPPGGGGVRGAGARAGRPDEASGHPAGPRLRARGVAYRRMRGLARAAAGRVLGALALLLPFAIAGALPNMWLAFGSFYGRRDILSGNAANVWWIANYGLRAYYQIPSLGFPHAFFVEVRRIMAVSTFQELGLPNPRPFAGAAVAATAGWGLWRLRRTTHLADHLLAAAFVVHAFFVLGVGVHEHHMMLAVPLLALAAALRPALRPLFWTVSAIVALNMNLFYGIGMGRGYWVPRLLLGIDLSVILSVANVAALVWHARSRHASLTG